MEHTPTPAHSGEHAAHPRIDYVGVFRWLALFTVCELAVSFVPVLEIKVPLLVVFAILKATLVVLYYMHLRYDRRVYAVILLTGVAFALLVGWFLPLIQR